MESQLVQVSCIFQLLGFFKAFLLVQGHHGWLHWFNCPIPDGGRPNTDVWPDVSSYSPSELFPAPGLKTESGEQTFLFSSRNAKTVQRYSNSTIVLIYALTTFFFFPPQKKAFPLDGRTRCRRSISSTLCRSM